jgi:tetratricopeptide (TPR) repeat protein
MGFRFFKRVGLAKGVSLNLSKSGGSVSLGPRGAKLTLGPQGARVSLGIPGTGLYYTTNFSLGRLGKMFGLGSSDPQPSESSETPTTTAQPTTAPAPAEIENAQTTKATLEQLTVPDDQKALADGCKALADGDEDAAFTYLQQATHLADGAFLAGVLALKREKYTDAVRYLTIAVDKESELGRYLASYGIGATLSLPITEEVTAYITPTVHGALLALAEAYQAQEKIPEAVACLEQLQQRGPVDVVVKLSLAELLAENYHDKETLQKVIKITEGVENESAVHAALLLCKAQALRGLGLLDGAVDVLTATLRRQKDRPEELLRALRYERALIYDTQGQIKKARTEFEKIYAEDPHYEDVAARLQV